MSAYLQGANRISLCCDIWSKRGLTSSYLGVTAHFFSRNDNRRHTATLAVRKLTSSHISATIRDCVEEILAEWYIDENKVSTVLTNNGSNTIAAFKARCDAGDDEEEIDQSTIQ